MAASRDVAQAVRNLVRYLAVANESLQLLVSESGKITWAQLLKIAQEKIQDTNAGSLEACATTLAGTCRSMGVDVIR